MPTGTCRHEAVGDPQTPAAGRKRPAPCPGVRGCSSARGRLGACLPRAPATGWLNHAGRTPPGVVGDPLADFPDGPARFRSRRLDRGMASGFGLGLHRLAGVASSPVGKPVIHGAHPGGCARGGVSTTTITAAVATRRPARDVAPRHSGTEFLQPFALHPMRTRPLYNKPRPPHPVRKPAAHRLRPTEGPHSKVGSRDLREDRGTRQIKNTRRAPNPSRPEMPDSGPPDR